MSADDRALETFLRDVDEIAKIVQDLTSADASCQANAFFQADKRLALLKETEDVEGCRTKLDRTVINSSPSGSLPHSRSEHSQGGFLSHLEKDAKERAERREENRTLANALKDLGNEAFVRGDYEAAVQRYSEGMDKLKDMPALYTNRAQAYIKLERYANAVTDCEWALKCNEQCIKAYVHMGRAYLGLKDYTEARKCYKKMIEINSNQENLAKVYLNQVDSQERQDQQEQKALEEFEAGEEGAVSVTELLQKISKANQIALYYSGGIKLLTEAVKDCTGQTLFRTNSGFSIIGDNKVINRSLVPAQRDPMNADLCLSVLTLWQTVCDGNEENQRLLISHPSVNKKTLTLLSSETPEIQSKTLALLRVYSMTENGRTLLLRHLEPSKLLQSLLGYARLQDARASDAMVLLHSLTLEERLKIHFRTNFPSASLPLFTHLLRNVKTLNRAVLPRCIGVMGNLSGDGDIRKQMAGYAECWDACLSTVDECSLPGVGPDYRDILFAVLGLMVNLSLEVNPAIQARAVEISDRCMSLLSSKDGGILTRSVGILSRILPQCTAAVENTVQAGVVKKLIKLLKAGGQRTSLYAVRALAVCSKQDTRARKDMMKYDKRFSILVSLLRSEDEMMVGNAALCLGNCFEIPAAASSLLQSDILKLLLTHAGGDAKKNTVQQNAAIALGKLCTAEPRYMNHLRELHGIEILNSCMKYMK
ncbi:tetratricopeptide repeat protein 12 [Ascaphus truei]|uniref:tetratricopeptide repeat protein 12 n=1 Tax=Ascaphus truei TaxID=8439 RepID=UPI003F5AA045